MKENIDEELIPNKINPEEETKTEKTKNEIKLEKQIDLLSIPIKTLINICKFNAKLSQMELKRKVCLIQENKEEAKEDFQIKGKYYNYLLEDVIKGFEKKNIKEVKLAQRIFKPEIQEIKFLVECPTQFGEVVLITGDKNYLGNWSNHKKLTYVEGVWAFALNHESPDSPFSSNIEIIDEIEKAKENANFEFEYKFIIKNENNGNLIWEATENRRFCLKEYLEKIEYYAMSYSDKKQMGGQDVNEGNIESEASCEIGLNKNDFLKINKMKGGKEEEMNDAKNSLDSSMSLCTAETGSNSNDVYIKVRITANSSFEYKSSEKCLMLNLKYNQL